MSLTGTGPFVVNNNRLQHGSCGIMVNDPDLMNSVPEPIPHQATITRNVISNINGSAIRVNTDHREAEVLVDHNTIHDVRDNGVYVHQLQLDRGVVVSNNIFSSQNNVVRGGGANTIQPDAHHNCYYDSSSTSFVSSRYEFNVNGNPLFVDVNGDDYALSPESTCIGQYEDGEDSGAIPSTGEEPSAGNLGFIREDRILGPGDVVLRGDMIVTAGATLSIVPGTNLLIETSDQMKQGISHDKIEIIVQDQGTLNVGGGVETVSMVSTPPSNISTGWYGIRIKPGGTLGTFDNVELKNMHVGLVLHSTGDVNLDRVTFDHFYYYGVEVHGDDGLLSINISNSIFHGGGSSNDNS